MLVKHEEKEREGFIMRATLFVSSPLCTNEKVLPKADKTNISQFVKCLIKNK